MCVCVDELWMSILEKGAILGDGFLHSSMFPKTRGLIQKNPIINLGLLTKQGLFM
jgi:hypothetical protein